MCVCVQLSVLLTRTWQRQQQRPAALAVAALVPPWRALPPLTAIIRTADDRLPSRLHAAVSLSLVMSASLTVAF